MPYLEKVTIGLFCSIIKTLGGVNKGPAFLGNWPGSAGLRLTLGLPNTLTIS